MAPLSAVPSDPDELRAWLVEHLGDDPQRLLSLLSSAARPSLEPFRNAEIDLPAPPHDPALLRVKVSLRGTHPPVWRRLQLRGDLLLPQVHDVLQEAMGWLNGHLHRFHPDTDERGSYFVTEFDVDEGDDGTPESSVRLDQLLRKPGDRIRYEYDFGDGWSHDLVLEETAALAPGPPRCLAGRRACPPEDVGGVGAHNELVAWFAAGQPAEEVPDPFDDVEHLRDWLPMDYDPAAFDLDEVNADLARRYVSQGLRDQLHPDLRETLERLDPLGRHLVDEALMRLPQAGSTPEDVATCVRPWRVLLDAIGDGVRLTAAGYLPPAVVEEVYQELRLEERWIGKGNREDLTAPVARLRTQAQRLGLLRKAKGILAPTAAARRTAADDRRLWEFVCSRLPLGKDGEATAGWFGLLLLAAGRDDENSRRGVAELLGSSGWRRSRGEPLDVWDAWRLCRDTVDAVIGPSRSFRDQTPPPWAVALAADVVRARWA